MSTTYTLKGETFTSPYTNVAAIATLRAAVQNGLTHSNFASSLLSQYDRKSKLSNKQWPWVHKLAIDSVTPKKPKREIEDTEFDGIVSLLDLAHSNLKYPKITVKIDGIEFRLSRASDRSRVPGSVNITDLGPFGDNTWFGRIHRDGKLEASKHMTSEIRERLESLNSDPIGFASSYGRMTGSCCFCHSPLTTNESVEAGYGPVCAKNWGLPWGNRKGAAA